SSSATSSLDRAGDEPGLQLALAQDEHDERPRHHHHGRRHHQRPRSGRLALQTSQGDLYRSDPLLARDQKRPQVRDPRRDEREHYKSREYGAIEMEHRRDDKSEPRSRVDLQRFVEIVREGAERVSQKNYSEDHRER